MKRIMVFLLALSLAVPVQARVVYSRRMVHRRRLPVVYRTIQRKPPTLIEKIGKFGKDNKAPLFIIGAWFLVSVVVLLCHGRPIDVPLPEPESQELSPASREQLQQPQPQHEEQAVRIEVPERQAQPRPELPIYPPAFHRRSREARLVDGIPKNDKDIKSMIPGIDWANPEDAYPGGILFPEIEVPERTSGVNYHFIALESWEKSERDKLFNQLDDWGRETFNKYMTILAARQRVIDSEPA
ncbi:MAG: hypothetical protein LBL71_04430 [Endomicrobium sp.]|jgi:hypothetical protein|nr:hypothetical protein [Endomicrobium sp.]